jgi:ketosteroid isomerase-like protein
MWSTREPVSVFGALGSNRHGRAELEKLMPRVAAQFTAIERTDVELVAAEAYGDFAYTVGYERTTRRGIAGQVVLRVTQIFRRENGEWKLAHRHGDVEPVDQVAESVAP